jgi:hypothetical protein
MDEKLTEYLKEHPPKGFRPVPFYSEVGDIITFFSRDVRCYEERLDDLVTIYLSMEARELVGCKIKGVKHLLQTIGNFGVSIDSGKIKLAFFFVLGQKIARDPEQRRRYQELASIAKDVELQLA